MLVLNHVQCKVSNLENTVNEFVKYGFDVEWGRKDKRGNAFIKFKSGPYIELFELSRKYEYLGKICSMFSGKALKEKWKFWIKCDHGWCDVGLKENITDCNDSISRTQKKLMESDIKVSSIVRGSRTDPKGVKLKYRFFAVEKGGFPFVTDEYDPPQNMNTDEINHSNGISEILEVTIGVSVDDWDKMSLLIHDDNRIKLIKKERTKLDSITFRGENDKEILIGGVKVFLKGDENVL